MAHHGPFVVRVCATPDIAFDNAIDYLIENKYFGVDFSPPLEDMELIEEHPYSEKYKSLGIFAESALISLHGIERSIEPRKRIACVQNAIGQGTLFKEMPGHGSLQLVPEPNY